MPIDYKKYPPNWKNEIVPFILNRENNCCGKCGVPNKSMQWRGRKWVKKTSRLGNKRWGWSTFHYNSKQEAIDDGIEDYDVNLYQTKIVLTIAHLDHDELNHEVKMDRLMAMCQLCHLKYDAYEKYCRTAGITNKENLNSIQGQQ